MDSTEFALTFLGGLISGVIIIVGGEMINKYLTRSKMNVVPAPQITTNTPIKHDEMLGFGVTIERKGLDDAYAKFNNSIYPWWENGKSKTKTDLIVGEDPSWIIPYYMVLIYIEDATKQKGIPIIKKGDPSNHAVLFSVFEVDPEKNTTKSKLFERLIIMPKNVKAVNIAINQSLPKFILRLLAKGIEKRTQYTGEIKINNLSIGKLENGVPSLDTSAINLTIYHY